MPIVILRYLKTITGRLYITAVVLNLKLHSDEP